MAKQAFLLQLSHYQADATTLMVAVNQSLVTRPATVRSVNNRHWEIVALDNRSTDVADEAVQQAFDQLMRRQAHQIQTLIIKPAQDSTDKDDHIVFYLQQHSDVYAIESCLLQALFRAMTTDRQSVIERLAESAGDLLRSAALECKSHFQSPGAEGIEPLTVSSQMASQ